MDREGFRNRLKQYKQAREENPGLKYWEWKDIPKYADGGDVMGPPTQGQMFKKKPTIFEDITVDPVVYNYVKEQSGRARYERAAHHTGSGDLANVISYMWDSNDENIPYYTGSYIRGFDPEKDYEGETTAYQGNTTVGQLTTDRTPNINRDLVKNFIYGDDAGFKKSTKRPLTVNGKTYEERQYEGTIAPIDTVFLPKSMVPTIDSLIAEKLIYSMNHNGGYTPSYYREDRLKNYTYDNVAKHSGVFRKNKKGEYSTELFDLWDFLGNYDYGWDWVAHKFQNDLKPDKFFPNAGPFILRQEIPIKFVEDSVLNETRRSGKYFLDRLDTSSNAASKILKSHVLKWNNKYAEGGEVEPDPLEVLERSKPKVAGIPINDSPIESVFSPWDIVLGTSYRLMPFVNKVLPNYGPALGTLVLGDAATSNKQQPLITKKLDPDVSEFYKDVVIPMNPNDEVYKQYFMKQFGNPDIEIHPASNLPDNFAADYNPNTNKIRIREDYAMSPNYQQIEAHEYGHLLDKYLPYDETTQQQLNNSLKVSKAPISKDSDTYREKQSTKREAEFKAFKNLKKQGKLKVKTSRAKTKRYQEYLANASDEEILELLGADTAYKQDYLAGNIDIDTLRQQMIYAPTITAGLVVPEYLLIDDEEEKQWT